MAYTPKSQYKGYLFSAEDFNGLKELLNGECNRRRGNGSVQSYAGSAYQFTTKPAAGGYVMAEHGKKTRCGPSIPAALRMCPAAQR